MRSALPFLNSRRARKHTLCETQYFRPRLEGMEDRVVPSGAPIAPGPVGPPAPPLGPAVNAPAVNAPAPAPTPPGHNQLIASVIPLTVNSVNITGVTGNTLQLVANAATPLGQTLQLPLTLSPGAAASPPGPVVPSAVTPVLNLHLAPINLDLLGLNVDTSEICLKINAVSGPGNLLGNLLTSVANLLNGGLNLNQILSSLSLTQLNTLSSGLSGLLNGALNAVGTSGNLVAGGPSATPGVTQVLDLTLGPVNLNLLGLQVLLNNCAGGPVTVDITAQSGSGDLLGNLVGDLANLLNGNTNSQALLTEVDMVIGDLVAIL